MKIRPKTAAGMLGTVAVSGWLLRRQQREQHARIAAINPRSYLYYMPNQDDQLVDIDGAINFRTLAGYPTYDGATIKAGLLYRSGSLAHVTDQGVAQMAALGLTTVCDLRSQTEVSDDPDRLPAGVTWLHRPLHNESPSRRLLYTVYFNRIALGDKLAESYIRFLDERSPIFMEMFHTLADPSKLPFLVHCTAGKDRTGVFVMLLLDLLGVPRETIVADYALSNLAYDALVAEMRRNPRWSERLRLDVEQLRPLLIANPANIERAYDHLLAKWSSAENYLIKHGFAAADIAAIRANLLEN